MLYVVNHMYDSETAEDLIKSVKKALNDLFVEFVNAAKPATEKEVQSSLTVATETLDVGSSNSFFSKYKRFKRASGKEENRSELEKYLAEVDERDDEDFDVLG